MKDFTCRVIFTDLRTKSGTKELLYSPIEVLCEDKATLIEDSTSNSRGVLFKQECSLLLNSYESEKLTSRHQHQQITFFIGEKKIIWGNKNNLVQVIFNDKLNGLYITMYRESLISIFQKKG